MWERGAMRPLATRIFSGAHCSEGTGTIPSVRGGEVPKLTGQGIGSYTGCWSDAFHATSRSKSWKGGGVKARGGDRGHVCFPVDKAVTKDLPLLLADPPPPADTSFLLRPIGGTPRLHLHTLSNGIVQEMIPMP